jgi:hypothetical protein
MAGGRSGPGGLAGSASGGGVFVSGGTLTLTQSRFHNNLAAGGMGGKGATGVGVSGQGGSGYNGGSGLGGGLCVAGGTARIFGGSVANNSAQGGAGGTGAKPGFGGQGGIGGNGGAGQGGGLYLLAGSLTLVDDTLAANMALAGGAGPGALEAGRAGSAAGGGLFAQAGSASVLNSTVALNTLQGSGAGSGVNNPGGTVTSTSSLFTGNYVGNVTADHSLFQSSPTGTITGTNNVVGSDPLLATAGLANNGGPSLTIALQAGSPALGAGANPDSLLTDQRGAGPRTGPGGTDIGAYQHDATLDTQVPTVSVTAAGINKTSFNPYTFTLTVTDNLALDAASLPGATIQIQPPTGVPLTATLTKTAIQGTQDAFADAPTYQYIYQIAPPGGVWGAAANGTYSIVLGGTPIADLAGNQASAGVVGTFAVQITNDHFNITAEPPNSLVAGVLFGFKVEADDSTGAVDPAYTGPITLTLVSNPAGAKLAGTVTMNAVAGVATFAGLSITTAGSGDTLNVSGGAVTTLASTPFTIAAATAKTLAVTGYPTSTTAGDSHTLTVTAYDTYGNVAAGYAGTVHFNASESKAVLPKDYMFTAVDAGQHSFPVTFETAGLQAVRARDTATTSITGLETGITVVPGAPDHLGATYSTATTAGQTRALTVTVFDAFNNVISNFGGTLLLTLSDPKAVITDASEFLSNQYAYEFIKADAGKHVFLLTLETAGTQSVQTGLPYPQNNVTGPLLSIAVSPAATSTLVVAGFPANITTGVASQLLVTAEDSYGNQATSYTGTVHFTSSDSQAVLPKDYTFLTADNSQHTFTVTFVKPGSQSIRATDTEHASITGVQADILVLRPAVSLTVTGFVSPAVAGVAQNLTVTALDSTGAVAKLYSGTVHFTSTDSQLVVANYTFTAADAGQHTFSVAFDTATTQAIRASDTTHPSITGVESGITVNPASAASLSVSGFPTTTTAGVAQSFAVVARDSYGNRATGYTGTIQFSSSDTKAGLPANYTFTTTDQGVHNFRAVLDTVPAGGQFQSISAADTATSSIAGSEQGISVNPIAATHFGISYPTSTTAGVTQFIIVSALDVYGNVATSYGGTVHFSSTDSLAYLPSDQTFSAGFGGVFQVLIEFVTAGSQAIRVTDTAHPSITGVQSNITVNPAAASSLAVSGFPTTATAGVAQEFSVIAHDAFGNVATSYTGTIQFSSSDTKSGLPASYAFTAADKGAHGFHAVLETATTPGHLQSLSAADTATSSIAGSEQNITVTPSYATHFGVSYPTATTAGVTQSLIVTAYDVYNNVATGYTGTIHCTSTDSHAVLPANYTFTAGDAGAHTFNLALLKAGTQAIRATDTVHASITGLASGVIVTAAAASTVLVTGFPTSTTIGSPHNVTLTLYDAYGNIATGYTGTMHLTSDDPKAALPPTDYVFSATDAGQATLSVTFNTVGTHWIKATDTKTSSLAGEESGIQVS